MGYIAEIYDDTTPRECKLALIDMPDAAADSMLAAYKIRKVATVALDYAGDYGAGLEIPVRGEYAIVRDEIRSQVVTESREVLVIIGGGDPRGLSQDAARAAWRVTNKSVLILGPHAQLCPTPTGMPVLQAPDDLPARMAACAWAVTSGGALLSEFLSLGKPVFVVPQNRGEMVDAEYYSKLHAVLGTGVGSIRRPTKLDRRAAAKAARCAVDGRGAERVAQSLVDRLANYWFWQ
jgi:spore coat polysaccharide biosynthesis predicted glycosyltransferase SpsG